MKSRKYDVQLRPSAVRDVAALGKDQQRRVVKALDRLQTSPRPRGARKLKGSVNTFRVRVGDYRIIYMVDDELVTVLVVGVRHRREAY